MTTHLFHLDLRVYDEDQLYQAAKKWAIAEGDSPEDADETLKPGGEIDVDACLVMLLDPCSLPGCKIYGSWTEST